MKNGNCLRNGSHKIGKVLLMGTVVLGLAHTAGAFGTVGSTTGANGTCAYSLQLQSSVDIRREYLVKLDGVLGRSVYTAGNSVDDMYDNIIPAAYTDEKESGTGGLSINFGSSSGGLSISLNSAYKSAAKQIGKLDSFTVDCISCHDGVSASQIQVDWRDRPLDRRSMVNSFSSDHPIGMTYDSYVAANRGYKDVGTGTKMVFVDGRVGCLTCHDPLNPEKGHLVMSDRNSALCKTCHDK